MTHTDPADTFLSAKQLAARYDVPLATVYRWQHHGTGPLAHKIGRHLRYRLDHVIAWEDTQADDRLADATA